MRYFIGHVTRMDASLVITRALKLSTGGLQRDWKLPPGHPYITLGYVHSTIEADLQPYRPNSGIWIDVSMEIRLRSLTLEEAGGNSYTPARNYIASVFIIIMMMFMKMHIILSTVFVTKQFRF